MAGPPVNTHRKYLHNDYRGRHTHRVILRTKFIFYRFFSPHRKTIEKQAYSILTVLIFILFVTVKIGTNDYLKFDDKEMKVKGIATRRT